MFVVVKSITDNNTIPVFLDYSNSFLMQPRNNRSLLTTSTPLLWMLFANNCYLSMRTNIIRISLFALI